MARANLSGRPLTQEERYDDLLRLHGNLARRELRWRRKVEQLEAELAQLRDRLNRSCPSCGAVDYDVADGECSRCGGSV